MTSEYESKEIKLTVDAAGIATDAAAGEVNEKSFWFKSREWIRSIGAEELGIERIPEEMRTNQNPSDLFTVFFSVSLFTPLWAVQKCTAYLKVLRHLRCRNIANGV